MLISLIYFSFSNSIFSEYSATPLSKTSPTVFNCYLNRLGEIILRQHLFIKDMLFLRFTPTSTRKLISLYRKIGIII